MYYVNTGFYNNEEKVHNHWI